MKRPASEEGYEFTAAEEAPAVEIAPEAEPQTPGEWVRRNLFSTPFSSILTILTFFFVLWVSYQAGKFVFVTADWRVFKDHLRQFMVGRFPLEEIWRVWFDLYLVALLVGLTRGVLPRIRRTPRGIAVRVVVAALAVALILYLIESSRVLVLLTAGVALFVVGLLTGRALGPRLRRTLVVAWVLVFPVVVLVLRAFDGVKPELWGGFLLNVIVAVVAIFVSFPIGLLLALGRRSTLPAVRGFCVGFIELIRGVPLVTLLIFGLYVLQLLLPPGTDLPNVVLLCTMFVVFSSAYVAEITRGGLQGVPEGQYEASRAVGLRYGRMMRLVVLPQALRNTIPAMISHFISLFKDTSLIAATGFVSELLAYASRSTRVRPYVGHDAEALLSAAAIFWGVAFAMARWSQRLEKRVGVGER